MINRRLLGIALPLVLGLGCAGSQQQRVQDARMSQIDAQEKQKLAAIDARTDAQRDGVGQRGEQHQENIETANQAGSEGAGELAEVSTERSQYAVSAGGRLDKLTVRLEAAKERTDVLGTRAPSALQSDIATALTEHKLLKQRVAELQGVDPGSWAQNKDAVESGMDTLEKRIDDLNRAIGDV